MHVYIAGPMRGRPEHNFPAFDTAHDYLEDMGWTVLSPAEMDRDFYGFEGMPSAAGPDTFPEPFTRTDWYNAMRRDIARIVDVDAIAVLPGWETSEGATVEVGVARAIGLPVFPLDPALFEETSEEQPKVAPLRIPGMAGALRP